MLTLTPPNEPTAMEKGKPLLGSLTLEGERLRAHVISDERAQRLRALLEKIAPTTVCYRISEIHDLSKAAGEAASGSRATASDIPPEVEAQLLAEFSGEYYAGWIDEPIPALDGRTPRHAARLKTQRAKVGALLRQIEMAPAGQHAPDMTPHWEELELTDLR